MKFESGVSAHVRCTSVFITAQTSFPHPTIPTILHSKIPYMFCLRPTQDPQVCLPDPPECEVDEDCGEVDDNGDPKNDSNGKKNPDLCQKCENGQCVPKVWGARRLALL